MRYVIGQISMRSFQYDFGLNVPVMNIQQIWNKKNKIYSKAANFPWFVDIELNPLSNFEDCLYAEISESVIIFPSTSRLGKQYYNV